MIAPVFGGGHSCKTDHGRCIKPAGSELTALARQALARGLERTGKAATADKLKQGGIKPCSRGGAEGCVQAHRRDNTFNLASDRQVLKIADDWRFLDEAADAASLFGGLLTFGLLNTLLIDTVKSDLTAYLTSQLVGSRVRQRL